MATKVILKRMSSRFGYTTIAEVNLTHIPQINETVLISAEPS